MYPQFFVFVEGEPELKLVGIIKGLLDLGYAPFVDGQNKSNENWFKQNLKNCQYRLYWFDEDGDFEDGLLGDDDKPDLLVAFSEGLEIGDNEWDLMTSLIKKVHCTNKEEVSDERMNEVFRIFEKPPKVEANKNEEKEVVALPTAYSFRSMVVENKAFFEIVKPNVIEPYVTMVEDYEKFPYDQYTNWFKCFSFGVSVYDAAFINQLFKSHHGDEILDLEEEFKKRVERVKCEDDEPRIWRNSLENVVEMYQDGNLGDKRKRMSINTFNKKV
jgi:hypothetical protein